MAGSGELLAVETGNTEKLLTVTVTDAGVRKLRELAIADAEKEKRVPAVTPIPFIVVVIGVAGSHPKRLDQELARALLVEPNGTVAALALTLAV
jgi:hypothetical protein